MALEVIMPKAGVDMTEGQIVQWNKKVGEFVKEGEILLEIMTDKVSMELEAEEDGYLIAILKGFLLLLQICDRRESNRCYSTNDLVSLLG